MRAKKFYTVSFNTEPPFNNTFSYPHAFRFLWTAKRFVKSIEDDLNFLGIKVSIVETFIGEYETVR